MTIPKMLLKLNILKEVYKDPERKSLLKIATDLITLVIYNRGYPGYYFTRYLFKKDRTNIKDYYSISFLTHNLQYLNEEAVTVVVQNKLYFDFFYNQFDIALPKILMYNHRKMFVIGKNNNVVNNVLEFKVQLETLFKQNLSEDAIIIKKIYESYGGDKIYKLFSHEVNTNPEKINKIFAEVIKAGFLFQKVVKQHQKLDKLNPSCLNTIRLDTFIDQHGNVEIMSGYIRMSYSNSHVDNISSGGLFVGVHLNNGQLKKFGYKTIRCGVDLLTAHPITNIIFNHFTIPFFEEAKDLVIKAASLMPGLRSVGWDIAISELGPVLIEGNSNYAADGNDITEEGYRSNSTFRKLLKEINNNR